MVSKKEKNHYDLKETGNHFRTKIFLKRLVGKREKANFRRTAKSIKMDNYITKKTDLSLQIRIVKST